MFGTLSYWSVKRKLGLVYKVPTLIMLRKTVMFCNIVSAICFAEQIKYIICENGNGKCAIEL